MLTRDQERGEKHPLIGCGDPAIPSVSPFCKGLGHKHSMFLKSPGPKFEPQQACGCQLPFTTRSFKSTLKFLFFAVVQHGP